MSFELTEKKQWAALFLLSLGYATIYLDMTALNIALPFIQETFSSTNTQLFWIVNAYIITTAAFALAGGRLGDIFGLRNIFLIGVSLFGFASIGCAVSFSSEALILWRAIQGVGGALTISTSAALIYQIFPREKQGRAMGFFGLTSVLFIMLGPTVGGCLTQYLSWRWVFWLNPMMGVISCSAIYFLIKGIDRLRDTEATFDFIGQLLLVGFMGPIIIALMQLEKWGWTSPFFLNLLAVGVVFFISFIVYEKRQKYPLFDFTLFENNNFKIAIILYFFSQFAVVSNVLFALYLEKSLGYKPLMAGIALLPNALLGFLGNPIAGTLIDKFGPKKVIQAGLLSGSMAFIWLSFSAYTLNYYCLLVALLVISIALPLYMIGIVVMAMHTASPNQKGMVAGISMTMRQTGGAFAVAFMALIVAFYEKKYGEILPPGETFTKGYSAGMLLIALALGVALYASIWIGQEKPAQSTDDDVVSVD
ncbi:MAG: Antiseptic resistance protein [Chlamydiae bacterium]|nr:Antiseptic resistance protein [Chlamydiota bacterium]